MRFLSSAMTEKGQLEIGIVSIADPDRPRHVGVDTWGRNDAGNLQTWTVVGDCLASRDVVAEGMIVEFATMGPATDSEGVTRIYGVVAGKSRLSPDMLAIWKDEFHRIARIEAGVMEERQPKKSGVMDDETWRHRMELYDQRAKDRKHMIVSGLILTPGAALSYWAGGVRYKPYWVETISSLYLACAGMWLIFAAIGVYTHFRNKRR